MNGAGRGGNDVQLQTRSDGWIALPQTRHLHHSSQTKQQTGERVNVNLQTIRRDAAGSRGCFIRSQSENSPAENCVAQDNRCDNRQPDCDPNTRRNQQPRSLGNSEQQTVRPSLRHVDRLRSGDALRQSTRDTQHPERGDERHDPQTRDRKSIYQTDSSADQNSCTERYRS